jgi:superfamily I DNA and/or RNA helicase
MLLFSNTYSRDIILSVPQPYLFIHVPGVEYKGRCGSYANNEECAKIVEIVENIWEKSKGRVSDWDSHDRLRIITFYQAQAALLKNSLAKRNFHKVLVATVDSSQGCEADTVIVSFTRSNNNKGVLRAAGFLSDDRRINVALTRGKHQLICVGNASTLGSEGSEALKRLVVDAKERGCITEKDAQL